MTKPKPIASKKCLRCCIPEAIFRTKRFVTVSFYVSYIHHERPHGTMTHRVAPACIVVLCAIASRRSYSLTPHALPIVQVAAISNTLPTLRLRTLAFVQPDVALMDGRRGEQESVRMKRGRCHGAASSLGMRLQHPRALGRG